MGGLGRAPGASGSRSCGGYGREYLAVRAIVVAVAAECLLAEYVSHGVHRRGNLNLTTGSWYENPVSCCGLVSRFTPYSRKCGYNRSIQFWKIYHGS